MLRSLLLLLLFFTTTGTIAQQLRLSKPFPMPPGARPLALLNPAGAHFYFLRFNRMAHDITIEKRRKSDGSIAAFAAFRMDSVNASWFDYDQLDHALIEKNGKLFFVFERVLNNQSKIFAKEIDTLCRTSGFIEIASLERDKKETSLELDFTVTPEKQLLVVKKRNYGPASQKQVELIDLESRKVLYRQNLPAEAPATGFSREMAFSPKGQLYYMLYRYDLRFYFAPQLAPAYHDDPRTRVIDSVFVVSLDSAGKFIGQRPVPLKWCEYIHALFCEADSSGFKASFLFTYVDSQDEAQLATGFLRVNSNLGLEKLSPVPVDSSLSHRLTFYDGTSNNAPGLKMYEPVVKLRSGSLEYFIAERKEPNSYREVFVWAVSQQDGAAVLTDIVPRKTFYFHNRVAHKTFGYAMHAAHDGRLYSFVLEHHANRNVTPARFVFRKFARLESESRGSLVAYINAPGHDARKKLLWHNDDYSCVPVSYYSTADDVVLYFVRDGQERFGLFPLNQL